MSAAPTHEAIAALGRPAVPDAVDRDALAHLDIAIWLLTLSTGAFVVLSIPLGGFQPEWRSFAGPASALAILSIGAWFYGRVRRDGRLASALHGTAQMIAFCAVGAPLSYVATAIGAPIPLLDHTLDAADKALGFDWRAMLGWMNSNSALHPIFREIYSSITMQAAIAILALAFSGRFVWLRVFLLSFVIATLAGIATAALLPSQGVWAHYGLTPQDHPAITPVVRDLPVAIVNGLRDGSYRMLLAVGAEGVITFPSLHAAFAAILVAAFWPLPALRWVALAVNTIMLVSTPVEGAHYLVDIFAGLLLAAIAVAAACALAIRAAGTPPILAGRGLAARAGPHNDGQVRA